MRSVALLLSTIALAAGVAGCGGSGDSSDSTLTVTTSSLSKAQYVKRANATCVREVTPILPRLSKYQEKRATPAKGDDDKIFGEAIKAVVPPAVVGMTEELRVLGAPQGDEDQIEALLVALEDDARGIEDGEPLSEPEELNEKFRHSGKLATEYTLSSCAFG